MNHPNHLLGQLNAIPIQMSSTAMNMGHNDSSIRASNGMQGGGIRQAKAIMFGSKKLDEGVLGRNSTDKGV